ncbi:MAG: branched-chain amino acid ABC transporter permease [Proteobacteria bacterium]|nr:branched-chain amino acid ABC transporter permease [Pseudomonadota bacterium]MBU1742521.1 branched-chain amino acid ABC transporter permease [Pseudomonadota bacterium]
MKATLAISLKTPPLQRPLARGRWISFLVLAAGLTALPLVLSSYHQSLMTRFLVFALFAMSFNLAFGYTGLLSLGHGAFFGAGAYCVALLKLHADVDLLWLGVPVGVAAATLVAALFGLIALRASGIYFLLVTFALGQMCFSVAWNFKWFNSTGMRGITGLDLPTLGLGGVELTTSAYYFLVLGVFLASLVVLYLLVRSPFGLSLVGIREDKARMEAIGYNTWLHKYVAFVVSGAFCGLAGTLFAYYNNMVSPSHLGIDTSFLPMVMAIIGGQGTLLGPAVGAAVVIFVEHFVSMVIPIRWPLVLGGLFVVSIMLARQGIWVYLNMLFSRMIGRYGSAQG